MSFLLNLLPSLLYEIPVKSSSSSRNNNTVNELPPPPPPEASSDPELSCYFLLASLYTVAAFASHLIVTSGFQPKYQPLLLSLYLLPFIGLHFWLNVVLLIPAYIIFGAVLSSYENQEQQQLLAVAFVTTGGGGPHQGKESPPHRRRNNKKYEYHCDNNCRLFLTVRHGVASLLAGLVLTLGLWLAAAAPLGNAEEEEEERNHGMDGKETAAEKRRQLFKNITEKNSSSSAVESMNTTTQILLKLNPEVSLEAWHTLLGTLLIVSVIAVIFKLVESSCTDVLEEKENVKGQENTNHSVFQVGRAKKCFLLQASSCIPLPRTHRRTSYLLPDPNSMIFVMPLVAVFGMQNAWMVTYFLTVRDREIVRWTRARACVCVCDRGPKLLSS